MTYDIVEGIGYLIEPHFCREWDEDGGCYGNNPNHGYSFEEAEEEILRMLQDQITYWNNITENKYNAS